MRTDSFIDSSESWWRGSRARTKARVLIVTDDPDVTRLLAQILSAEVDLSHAVDGAHTLEVLARGPLPDLILSDLVMPRMDGLALLAAMHAEPRYARIPVLVLTEKITPGEAIAGLNAGARCYATKPLDPDDLLQKVKRCIEC